MAKHLKKKKIKIKPPSCEVKQVAAFLKSRNLHLDSLEKEIWNQKIQ